MERQVLGVECLAADALHCFLVGRVIGIGASGEVFQGELESFGGTLANERVEVKLC